MNSRHEEFSIPDGRYTPRSFKKWIIDNREGLFSQGAKRKWIKVYGIRTRENEWQKTLKKYLKRELGEIWQLSLPIRKKGRGKRFVDFYVYSYSRRLLLFYTASKSEEYENVISKLIKTTPGLGQMWIGPKKFEELIVHFVDKFEGKIERFYANSTRGDPLKSKIRPYISRQIYWRSKDSYETLFELKEQYGVRPTRVMMRLNKGVIQLSAEGLFILTRVNQEMFDALEDVFDYIRGPEEHLTAVSQEMNLGFERIHAAKGDLLIPMLTSGTINLHNTQLNNVIVDKFMETSEFDFIDVSREEGSFSWVATAIDREKRSVFAINSDENAIHLIPRQGTTFESLLGFYLKVLEDVDDRASLETFGAPIER